MNKRSLSLLRAINTHIGLGLSYLSSEGSPAPTGLTFMGSDLSEAILYAEHPILGPRLDTCFKAILRHPNVEVSAILGETDAYKLKSCATLFSHTVLRDSALELLSVFYAGELCAQSEELLARDR